MVTLRSDKSERRTKRSTDTEHENPLPSKITARLLFPGLLPQQSSSATAASVDDFVRRDEATGAYFCASCSQTSRERSTMVRHVEAKHYSPGYECAFCRKPYNARYQLLRHLRKYHQQQYHRQHQQLQ